MQYTYPVQCNKKGSKQMKKIFLAVMVLMLTISLAGCTSEADKKADQFVGVWQYEPPKASNWDSYFVISKVDGQKGYFKLEEKSIALNDGPARKKGQPNHYNPKLAKIDKDGNLRFEQSKEYIMINKDGTEITKDGDSKYHKAKELPEGLKTAK